MGYGYSKMRCLQQDCCSGWKNEVDVFHYDLIDKNTGKEARDISPNTLRTRLYDGNVYLKHFPDKKIKAVRIAEKELSGRGYLSVDVEACPNCQIKMVEKQKIKAEQEAKAAQEAKAKAEWEAKAAKEAKVKAEQEAQVRNDSFNRRYVELKSRFDDLKASYDNLKNESKNLIKLKNLCEELYEAAQGAWLAIGKTIDTDAKKQLALEIAANCKILREYDKEGLFNAKIKQLEERLQQFEDGDYADYANLIFKDSKILTFRGAVPQGNFTSQSSNEDAEEARPQQAFQHRAFSP